MGIEQRAQKKWDAKLKIAGSLLAATGAVGSIYFGFENDTLGRQLSVTQSQNVDPESIQKMENEKSKDEILTAISIGSMVVGFTLIPRSKNR